MPGRGSKRHIHKYHKVEANFSTVWACALPDCTHFMPNQLKNLVEGKGSICWDCGEQFVLDKESMKMDRPTCMDCRHPELKVSDDDLITKLLLQDKH